MTEKRKVGRPTKYTPEIGAEICSRISAGESLNKIIKSKNGELDFQTVYRWLFANKDFSEQYARARADQADTMADEIHAISDERPRMIVDDKGVERVDNAYVNWQRLRVDSRKWIAAKLKPKKYGEKVATELTGKDGGPLQVEQATVDATAIEPEQRDALRDILLNACRPNGSEQVH